MKKTVKIDEKIHRELLKIMAELTTQNGKRRTFDDVVLELIKKWKEKK